MTELITPERRAAIYAALAQPARLAIVDALAVQDASPGELCGSVHLPSNLLAHHLRVLEEAGVITRSRSEADRRRAYVRLVPAALAMLVPAPSRPASRVVFVFTRNSARSQLAAALWAGHSRVPAVSAGTHPSARIHQRAISTARRHGLALDHRRTAHVRDVIQPEDLVVAVCDSAYEELRRRAQCLHWSVPDPVRADTDEAFEQVFEDIEARVVRLTAAVGAGGPDAGRMP